MNKTKWIQIGSVTPSALLLGLLYVDHYADFLIMIPISWLVACFYTSHSFFNQNALRHFFTILTLFVLYNIWALFFLFPLPHFHEYSPVALATIFSLVIVLIFAFLVCCTRLYNLLENKLLAYSTR